MADTQSRLYVIRSAIGFGVAAAVLACGPDPQSPQARQKAPAHVESAAPTAPMSSYPSISPQLREQMRLYPAVKRFVVSWKTNPAGIWSNRFLGVKTIQNPLDAWVTQEILFEVRPDYVVETGTFQAMMDVALVNDGPVTFVLEEGTSEGA